MFCTQPFNHIDVVVENDKVLLQPCNVWNGKKLNINEYKNNLQQLKGTLSETYYYPGVACVGTRTKTMSDPGVLLKISFRKTTTSQYKSCKVLE